MSNHVVEHENYLVMYGWDRPMRTFFAQVHDTTKDPDEAIIVDIGDVLNPLSTLTDFKTAFAQQLENVGINDFELSIEQEKQMLADCDGVDLS